MTLEEKAMMILESMEEYVTINWNMKDYYLKGIIAGLKNIEKENQ